MDGRPDRRHEDDSPGSADEAAEEAAAGALSPPKKSRRGSRKRVVTVQLGDGSKTEVHPPPDSGSWRKYGQKPIKGSPYPRGYYRCSSSKGCPARKQVERSRHDPTALIVTYSCEHNHPLPTAAKAQRPHPPPPPDEAAPSSPSSSNQPAEERGGSISGEQAAELADDGFAEFLGELGWVCDVGSTMMNEITFVGPPRANADAEALMPIGEEDKLLFGDLGDLPEYSVVFRRPGLETLQ